VWTDVMKTQALLQALTAGGFDAAFGGDGPTQDMLMWGLPVPVAYRIGKRALKYELVRQQHKLSRPLARLRAPASALEVRERTAFPEETDALFARLAPELDRRLASLRADLEKEMRRAVREAVAHALAARAKTPPGD